MNEEEQSTDRSEERAVHIAQSVSEDEANSADNIKPDTGERVVESGSSFTPTNELAGFAEAIQVQRSAPLPTVEEFQGYEQVLNGAADRILTMAERSLDAEIADRVSFREAEAHSKRAENTSMIIASVAFSFLPWVGFIAAIVCAFTGNNLGTAIGSMISVISAGPQIIDSIKHRRS